MSGRLFSLANVCIALNNCKPKISNFLKLVIIHTKRGFKINKASYIPGFYSHSVIILSDRCQIQALSLSLYIDGVMPTILRNSSTNVVYDLKPTLSAMAFSV